MLIRDLLREGVALNVPTFFAVITPVWRHAAVPNFGQLSQIDYLLSKFQKTSNQIFFELLRFSDVTSRDFGPKIGYCLRVHKRQTIEWKRIQDTSKT